MDIPLDEVVYFDVISSSSTGAAADADSTPTFEVFEESTDTDIGVGGNLTKRTSKTGNYRGTFTLSAANGFEVGKWYSIIASATIGGVAAKCMVKNFRVIAAEATAGYPAVDAAKINNVATTSVTTISAYLGSTGAAVNGTNVNTLSGHDPGATLGTSTLTQTQVTGGAYALNSASFAFNSGLDFTTTQKAATLARVTLTDTVTTYTGNTPQTGDSYARIGANGVGLTSVALADATSDAVIADAVWNATTASYGSAGSYGELVETDLAAILDDTGTSGVVVAGASKTGYSLAAAGLDSIVVETGLNARQALSVAVSAAAGVLAGAATTTITIAAAGVPATNRITATVDGDGNRSDVTLSLPA